MAKSLNINSTRIISPKTLNRYIVSGRLKESLIQGYIFNSGCGKFTKEVCTCNLCVKDKRPELDSVLSSFGIEYHRPELNLLRAQ